MGDGVKAAKISRQVTLSVAFQEVHSVDARRALTVNLIRLSNTTGGAVTVQVCYAPTGVAAAVGNAVLWDFSIPANDFIEFGEGDIVRNASVQAKASADNSVNIRLTGTEEGSI